jgi:hypothetical protein
LKILRLALPSALAIIFINASMPSLMPVKQRRCRPPSTRRTSSPRMMCPRNCVMTRELPSLAACMLSSPGPIQLNGRNSV